MRKRQRKGPCRLGAIAPLTAVLMIPMLGLTALAIDLGYLALVQTQLQNVADAAAMAAATEMITNQGPEKQVAARALATEFGRLNEAGGAPVVVNSDTDITFGFWNPKTRKLDSARMSEPNIKVNAVRVAIRQQTSLFFAPLLGTSFSTVRSESIAYAPNPTVSPIAPGHGTRFLLDDEMFNTGEPVILMLASQLRMTPEQLLSARNEKSPNPKDWFLNLPAGAILNLPTGQVGDEGLFDIAANTGNPSLPQYPFMRQADHTKFLMYNNTSENDSVSRLRKSFFSDSQLDPLHGVGRFNQPSHYPELVNKDFIHISPVYKSDISALDSTNNADEKAGPDLNNDGNPDGYTTNKAVQKGVCAKDYRRGLVAFKIIGYNLDSSRGYPYLPRLTIQIVDPTLINLDATPPLVNVVTQGDYKAGGVKNVRIVQ
jgi:Flp pilus assembly protein TadG